MQERDFGPEVAALVTDLGALTLALEKAGKGAALGHRDVVVAADAALIRASEMVALVLLSDAPEKALSAARSAVDEARQKVELVRTASGE
jgi:hypothetical protein